MDHSKRHLKQNWCIHESEKHLFVNDPKQIAQFGGGLLAEFGLFINLLSAIAITKILGTVLSQFIICTNS